MKSSQPKMRPFAAASILVLLIAGCMHGDTAEVAETEFVPPPFSEAQLETFHEAVVPFIDDTCLKCHDFGRAEGDLDLETFLESEEAARDLDTWVRVRGMLASGQMPPPKRPRPDPDELSAVLNWIDGRVKYTLAAMPPDPGRVTARRLNRAEYNNTVRDLLGVDFEPSEGFPVDDSGYGYDTIGDVLSISPLLMEKYFDAADEVARRAIESDLEHIESGEGDLRIITCGHAPDAHNAGCARALTRDLAHRAFRRPATRRDVSNLVALFKDAQRDGAGFTDGMTLVTQAVLVSPHFLFRIENTGGRGISDLDDFQLASRLSYFLWSSMPDETLYQLAEDGQLRDDGVLEAQVKRMLTDPRADALVDNFAGQWLELRNMAEVRRDRDRFPDFGDELRVAMREETEMLFQTVVQEDLSVLRFLDADFTYVNEILAKHYGIDGVEGKEMRRVPLAGTQRVGIMTHASVLTLTSYPTRTSPVLRGKWVLEKLLGAPPPPPPPDVPSLDEEKAETAQSLRAQLEQHRADPGCASCHSLMDPLGFGLENYDAIGRWRESKADTPIDSSGELPSGERFNGPAELQAILFEHREEFVRSLVENMLIYALGRGLERYDRLVVDEIRGRMEGDDFRFSSMVLGIVESMPFQKRRGAKS